MIQFRCWYCERYWRQPAGLCHTKLVCRCGHRIRVPKRNGLSSRPWSFTNWFLGALVYGGGMGLFAFVLALVFFGRNPLVFVTVPGWLILGGTTALGALIGIVGGESGCGRVIDWFDRHGRTVFHAGNPGLG